MGDSAVRFDLPSITKQPRVINVRWLKLYKQLNVLHLEEPVRNKIEAAARADEITAIAGIVKDYLDVFWQDCKPEHATPMPRLYRLISSEVKCELIYEMLYLNK